MKVNKKLRLAQSGLLAVLLLAGLSCDSRTDEQNAGVILSFSDFDELPVGLSVNNPSGGAVCSRSSPGGCVLSIGEVSIRSIVANPNGTTSDLMTVEINSYEVRFTRRQPGSRTPPPFFQNVFGSVEPGSEFTLEDFPIMGPGQLLTPPLSDLLFAEGAVDDETGSSTIILDAQLRFFGRTVSGEAVATEEPARFTLTVLP